MSIVRNITESTLLLQGPGKLKGIVVNSHTSGTLKIYDGLEAGVVAVGTITQSVGAATPAYHAQNVLTSTGAMVAGSHASATLTVSGAVNFKDAVKGSGVLTSNQSQPTAGQVVVLGNITYTFRALGTAQVSTATACNVNLGNTAKETMVNLYQALLTNPLVDAVLTSAYVITVTAKTAGTAGNMTATENSTTLSWDDGSTLTGGLDAETITIGDVVYTWKDTLDTDSTSTAVQVKIAATSALSLVNLKYAINATAAYVGSACGKVTTKNLKAICTATDATTATIRARVPGTTPNAYATTETCAQAAFGGTTLGGAGNTAGVTTTGATITIGATVYTIVDVLSETLGATAVAYQVYYGTTVATMLDNLKAAINGTGTAGTEYSTGTVAHPDFVATTNTDTAQTIRSRKMGTAAEVAVINALATTETLANTTWADSTCGGGTGNANPAITSDTATITINGRVYTAVLELSETIGATAVADEILWVTDEATFLDNLKAAINASGTAGTEYSTGTTAHKDVKATTNGATTQVIQSRLNGVAGNAITTTATLTNYAWGATTLASGTGLTSKVMFNTITLGTLTAEWGRWIDLGDADFTRGVFVVCGGTVDVSFVVDLT